MLASCSNDVTISENTVPAGSNAQKEIAFSPLSNTPKRAIRRAAILDNVFPTTSTMEVAAFDAENNVDFFDATTFKYNYAGGASGASHGYWGGDPARYWPLSAATINFLGYAHLTEGSATWNASHNAAGVTLVMADNSSEQKDLMYAVGQGQVTQTGNSLNIPEKVDMVYVHAQALLVFNVKANLASSITLKKITMNNAYYGGTLTIDNSNYSSTGTQSITSATWGTLTNQKATLDIFDGTYAVTTSLEKKAESMVVPNPSGASFDSFTLTYRIAGVDKDFTYTFTPTDRNLAKATKYVYDITFTLHEILIDASVTAWTESTPNTIVDVPTKEFAYAADGSADFNIPAAAGKYTFTITGIPAGTYTVEEGSTGTDFITGITTSDLTVAADGSINVTVTVSASASATRPVELKLGGTTKFTVNVKQGA